MGSIPNPQEKVNKPLYINRGCEILRYFTGFNSVVFFGTIVSIVTTILIIREAVKLCKLTRIAKMLISYWVVWVGNAILEILSDNYGSGIAPHSEFSLYLIEHAVIGSVWSLFLLLIYIYVSTMPYVLAIWIFTKRSKA